MAALATQTDLEERIGPLTSSQVARVAGLLADASAEVRDHTGQQFEAVDNDEVVVRANGSQILLPRRPVRSVASVTAIKAPPDSDELLPVTCWAWDGTDRIQVSWVGVGLGTYRVVYSHSVDGVPDMVLAVVCAMVNRVLTAPGMSEGLVGETIGQYSYQTQQGSGTQGLTVSLTAKDKLKLRRWTRNSATIRTPVG